jgi:hypothetical protein
LYIGTCDWRPVRLKSSSIKSSLTSAKYSWPIRLQNEAIQLSGPCEEVTDMSAVDFRKVRGVSKFDREINSMPDLHGQRPEDLFVLRGDPTRILSQRP